MKKIKFLSGIGAAFALAAVALTTTFTSCEKEQFVVDITPVKATATIKPSVLLIANGTTTDVTSSPNTSIEITPAATFEGNPNLDPTQARVKATYNDLSAEVTVDIPALTAGQAIVLTPTIVLQEENPVMELVPNIVDPVTTSTEKTEKVDNTTDYWNTTTIKYTQKEGNKVLNKEVYTEDLSVRAQIDAYYGSLTDAFNATYKETLVEDVAKVYAHSRTQVAVTYVITTIDYQVLKKAQTKADADELLASWKVENYATQVDIKTNEQIPGHNHAPAGHGHGHGGDNNAGGGIVIAD